MFIVKAALVSLGERSPMVLWLTEAPATPRCGELGHTFHLMRSDKLAFPSANCSCTFLDGVGLVYLIRCTNIVCHLIYPTVHLLYTHSRNFFF
jgi:hypothetical protein